MTRKKKIYLVHYGTCVELVEATTIVQAFAVFVNERVRGLAIRRNEVKIRRVEQRDEGWIRDSGDARAITLFEREFGIVR